MFDTDVRTADFFMLGSVQGLVLITTILGTPVHKINEKTKPMPDEEEYDPYLYT